MFVETLNAQPGGRRKGRGLDLTRRTAVLGVLNLCWTLVRMRRSGAFFGGHGGDQNWPLFVPSLEHAMASRYKGRAGLSRSSKTKSSTTGTRGCQRSLYSFMESKPKATQAPQQLSPIVSSSPFAKTEMVSSTSGSDINAGEKRKKAKVIELTSDEDDPPLKRRKLVVDSSSPTRPYQVLTTEKSSMAKQLASGSPRKWTMPDFAASTPCSDPKTYFRGLQLSDLQSQRPQEGRGRSGEPSSPVDLPTFPPEGGHEMNTVRVDMELDMVPCSQVQDDLPLAFPPIAFLPIAPSTLASPLRPITPPPQRNSLFLPTFTPKLVQVSQQQVPSSATPSDLRESCDVHIMRTEAPHVPVFTLSSPNYIEERPQTTDLLLPSSSFPRYVLPVMSMIYHLSLLR